MRLIYSIEHTFKKAHRNNQAQAVEGDFYFWRNRYNFGDHM
jgi:hypothetical protein